MALDLDSEERTMLIEELERLRDEHRDLDMQITALEDESGILQLQVQRLKKKKLHLKDRIAYLDDRITPDIIA